MKKVFLALVCWAMATVVSAIPAKPGLWSTIRLDNGKEVTVQKVGDEHGHWLRAADGTCYVLNDGTYVQVDAQELRERREARLAAKYAKRKVVYASTSDGLGKLGKMSMGAVPSIGEYAIPVVMVQFSNTKFKSTTTVEKMTRFYNEEGYHDENGCVGSVKDYFVAQSGGQFVPTFDVVGIVTLSKASSYYGKDQGNNIDEKLSELPRDVIKAAVEQLGADFSKYVVTAADENHQAGVPLMCMLYAGKGQATEDESYANNNLIWPCEWDAEEDYVGYGNYEGVHFNSFFVGNELLGDKLMGMSVFCHEFGHALGLPDFYVTDYSYEDDNAFGHWSVMDTGAYLVSDCRAPVCYNAYEKSYMGWLELKEVGDEEEVTLMSPEGKAENSAYIIRNSSSETFIFENRQPGTWHPQSLGSGVLVSRIAYNKTQWNMNTLNNVQSKKRACVLTANGAKLSYSASPANLYGNNGKNSIATLKTYSGTNKEIGLQNVTKNADGTVTLSFKESGEEPQPQPQPEPLPEGVLFYESFDQCTGKGGNDNSWSGQIANGQFLTDNNGWEAEKAFGAFQCAKFGTSSVAGSATMPAVTVNGNATLTFMAGAWNGSNDGKTLMLVADGGDVEPETVTMTKGMFKEFTATVTAVDEVKISFVAEKGRFFLDEVTLSDNGSITAIKDIHRDAQDDERCYNLAGQRVEKPVHGIYVINGKKFFVK